MGSIGTEPATEPIAIVGLSCKFAGEARSPQELWRMLEEGGDGWSEIPLFRFNSKGYFHPDREKLDTMHVQGGHFLQEDIAHFDAPFFNFSSELAAALDPQFRLQLESVYEALENAGLPMSHVAGSNTSVFAALWKNDYRDGIIRDEQHMPRSLETGTGAYFAANRISHFFDLRGASMTIDTACSGSMVALHQAVQSLRSGEASMSIVGGSNLALNPDVFVSLGSTGFLSAEGKSFAFDSRANGFGRGEGVAALVIKRLRDALSSGDPVRAVIRETHLNQDGKTDSITSPSQAAQEALMRHCYLKAGLDPRDTQYFEAHGTGTKAGDPIEARAIAAVFRPESRPASDPLRIGSIKTNIGHTEAASGLAAIIKVVLAMEKAVLPPSVNFDQPNPQVSLGSANLKLVTTTERWHVGGNGARQASVNNFGAGGTNGHVILESGDSVLVGRSGCAPTPSQNKYKTKVLVLSGRSEQACKRSASNLKAYLQTKKGVVASEEALLENVMYTLGQRRTLFSWRAAHRVPFSQGIDQVTKALDSPQFTPIRCASQRPRIGMVFTGQGAQWHAMGRELIIAYPPFKASLEEGDVYLRELGAEWSLLEELHRDADTSKVNDTSMSIPICVALQISLVRLLRSWGVTPTAVASHSSGEIAAAYTVGALSYKSAMAASYYRAVLAADKSHRYFNNGVAVKGAMIAIGASVEYAELYLSQLKSGLAVTACINSPSSVTVAGDASAIQEIENMAKADGVFARTLRVETAYHSHHMDPIAEPYREALMSHKAFCPPAKDSKEEGNDGVIDTISFSSAVTGSRIYNIDELADPEHWVESLTQPVRFIDAISDMVLGDFDPSGTSVDVIVEVGPHAALGGPIKEIMGLPEFNGIQIPYYSCLVRKTNARDSIQDLVANLLRDGCPIELGPVNFPWGKWPHIRVLSDLPSYPWDHNARHWHESRVNKALREKALPPNDLLGSLEPGVNPRNPSWRQVFRIVDSAWVRDHVVDSMNLYPAAGFICRAIEAVTQMTKFQQVGYGKYSDGVDTEKTILGYRLRDVDIQQALVLHDDNGSQGGLEIHTGLSPLSDNAIGAQGWTKFTISSVTTIDAKWTQHVTGLISVDFSSEDSDVCSLLGASTTVDSIEKEETALPAHSARTLDADDFYSSMRASGIKYGLAFRNIKTVLQSRKPQRSETIFAVADTESWACSSHVLHPTTLESVIQTAYTTVSAKQLREGNLKVPQSISKLWVSNAICRERGHRFKAHASRGLGDARSMHADISVVDLDPDYNNNVGNSCLTPARQVLKMDGVVLMSINADNIGTTPDVQKQHSKMPWEKEICSKVEWLPDFSLATPASLQTLKEKQLCTQPDPKEAQVLMGLRRVCIYFIQDALAEMTKPEIEQLNGHHRKYYEWLQNQLWLAQAGKLGPGSEKWTSDDSSERCQRMNEVAMASVSGEMVCRLGPQLAAILRGDTLPLELMKEDNLLYNYHMVKADRSFQHAVNLLQLIVHKNPRSHILEIGGGAGSLTRYALKSLGTSQTGGPMASLYHFTDIDAACFETVTAEFSEWIDITQYSKFDAEKDPTVQGFESGSYDVVIASQVLHATTSVANTMANVRKLLKPGGTLLIVETTKDQVDVQFVFGLLASWWLGEEGKGSYSQSLSIPYLDGALKNSGFTGIDLEVHDCESEDLYSVSTIMSTAAQPSQSPRLAPGDVVIVTSRNTYPMDSWLESLQHSIASICTTKTTTTNKALPAVQPLEHCAASEYIGKFCIFLGEMREPILYDLDIEGLEGIKKMATSCKGLLWVTQGSTVNAEYPNLGLAAGFMRTLRNEYVGRKFLNLDLDPNTPVWSESATSTILQILKREFGASESAVIYDDIPNEFEYAERDGCILVPRVYKDMNVNKAISPEPIDYSAKESSLSTKPFHQETTGTASDYPLRLQAGIPGVLDSLAFSHDAHDDGDFTEDCVQIEPRAFGVKLRNLSVAFDPRDGRVLDVECAGLLTKVGSLAASHGFAPGDRVLSLLQSGSIASLVSTKWTNVVHIPAAASLSFEEAATIPFAFCTALISLGYVARLEKGQSVLIHAAATGVGQAAIMVSRHIGATIYVTVNSPEEREWISSKYGIQTDHIFSSRDTSFARGVLSATSDRGVDIVLNSLTGPLLQASFETIAPFGHFLEIGGRDIECNASLEMGCFSRHVSFTSVNLPAMMRHRAQAVHWALTEISRLLTDKVIAPVSLIASYPIDKASEAFKQLLSGIKSSNSKLVLTASPHETVPVLPRRRNARLSPDVSYLLVGAVGDMGRSVVAWMIEHGARNLILLSLNAGGSQKTRNFLEHAMQESSCRIKMISCDVANAANLVSALQKCWREKFPPIRGVIQAATVRQDSLLERMTIDAYKAAILPKVHGTWNLHLQFANADDLDFFVILSSNVGTLGNASQASYAAGATYQDALARWRVGRGLPCVCIDALAAKSVNHTSETTSAVRNRMARLGHMLLDEEILLKLIESAILAPHSGQILAGINVGPGEHWNQDGPSQLGRDARFRALRYRQPQKQHKETDSGKGNDSLASQLATVSPNEAGRLVSQVIAQKLADVFTIPADDVDMSKAPGVHGVDSLVAVELRNMLRHQVGAELSSFEIMQSTSLAALAGLAASKCEYVNQA